MGYLLDPDGDYFEQRYVKMLHDSFPNYEIVGERFVVPLTCRRFNRNDISLIHGLDLLLEDMCMSHYSVYYHLGKAHDLAAIPHLINGMFYDDVFFHLGAAGDMVVHFLWCLARLHLRHSDGSEKEYPEAGPFGKLDCDQLLERAKRWRETNYSKHFRGFYEQGRAVGIPLHSTYDVADALCTELGQQPSQAYRKWQDIDSRVRQYRNAFTHNPVIGRLVSQDGRSFVPNKNLPHYRHWSRVKSASDLKDFVDLDELTAKAQLDLEQATNELWTQLMDLLNRIASSPEYRQAATADEAGVIRSTNSHEGSSSWSVQTYNFSSMSGSSCIPSGTGYWGGSISFPMPPADLSD